MAISRHKVLSELQQQLELASSKCGNLQKQLEIVKDKVRQSSTTNLVRIELPENKENKTKTGESLGTTETNKETDYSQALSISSSSSDEDNEERDGNIIKVFYDRLGQMDYPKSQVELSDISSVDNLDVDQLLSSVNFSMRSNEGRKEKRAKKVGKKGKDKIEKAGNQKRKPAKGKIGVKNVSPYENTSTKLLKQIPAKKKNIKAKPFQTRESLSATAGMGNKPASRGIVPKAEADKMKKRKQVTGLPEAKNNRKIFQEPIKRVMNLASQLRKTKSSTAAQKRESFADTRSLTHLHSDAAPPPSHETSREEKVVQETRQEVPRSKTVEECKSPEKSKSVSPKVKLGVTEREHNRMAKNEIRIMNRESGIKPPWGGRGTKISQQDKGTSLSDLAMKASISQRPEVETPNKNITNNANNGTLKTTETAASVKLMKKTDFKSRRSFDVKVPSITRDRRGPERKPWTITKPPIPVKIEGMIANKAEKGDGQDKPKNGIIPHLGQDTKPGKTEVKKRVDLFEQVASKDKEIDDIKGTIDNGRPSSKLKGTSVAISRANSSTYDDISRRGLDSLRPASSVNTGPPPPALRGAGDYSDQYPNVKTVTISQIKKMKDNLMKFNTIPFIVGQSTSKSYHIGLNIQETYSLFKQTPSMTALMVSKYGDPDHQSVNSSRTYRARSTRTGYTGRRSVSSGRGRETCPACEPVPQRSPEQLTDPWAVPQDGEAVVRVCTCLPKRMTSFDQVLNQLYFSNVNLVKLHPTFLPKDGIIEESEEPNEKEKPSLLPHRPTNTLYYTKLLRSIQNLKDNIMG